MTASVLEEHNKPQAHHDENQNQQQVATTTTTSNNDDSDAADAARPQLPLPVDRQWLVKLMKRHYGDSYNPAIQPITVLAPMVDQSDLPFRLLTRKYSTRLCFTPMIHCKLFSTSKAYRRKFSLQQDLPKDRPLVAQLCGSDLEACLYTALAVAPYCDAVDINCGCPQGIARRGNYGAFLLEQPSQLIKLCRHLCRHVPVPVTVKVRLLPAPSKEESLRLSLELYQQLVDAGIHMLTVHGRTRHEKGPLTGAADWEAIRAVVETIGQRIPIVANGSISSAVDACKCLQATGADGIMSSEAILEYPALFADMDEIAAAAQANNATTITASPPPPRTVGRVELAIQYLELARQYPTNQQGQGSGIKCMRAHVHRILHADLQSNPVLRQKVIDVDSWQGLWDAVQDLKQQQHCSDGEQHVVANEQLSWYMRHRTVVQVGGTFMSVGQARKNKEQTYCSGKGKLVETDDEDDYEEQEAECRDCLFGQAEDDADY